MRSAAAGTFNVLHDGHRALLDRALSVADDTYIGITSDSMASGSRTDVLPFYMRRKAVEDYVASKGRSVRIFPIDDIYGPADMMDSVDILVVSEETEENGRLVVEKRRAEGGRPLELSVVPLMRTMSGDKISATGILNGEYSRRGDVHAIRIGVGSMNHVKTEAVREVMEEIFGQVIVLPKDVSSGVPEQPFGDQTYQGAVNRAKAAAEGCDLSVGIEAGVFELYGELIDVQHCAIVDGTGRVTVGMGSGFAYPPQVAELVRGGLTVGQAVDRIYSRDSVGHSEGAIGLLSKGLLDRKDLTKQSVLAAMVPRL